MRDRAEQRALELGIQVPQQLSLPELVHIVQLARGHTPCFRSEQRYRCLEDCEWSAECRKLLAEWRR